MANGAERLYRNLRIFARQGIRAIKARLQRESKAEVSRHCLFVSTACISQQNQQLDLAGGCNAIHGTLWFGDRTRTTFELPMTYSIQTGIGMLWACC